MAAKVSIFNTIKRIVASKEKWEDIPEEERGMFNNYMANKVLSMNENFIELVNIVQKNTWQMEHKHLYNLYKEFIPKQYYVFSKYIKNENKSEHKIEDIEAVSAYYDVSKKEAKEYIDMLPKDELETIKQQINGK